MNPGAAQAAAERDGYGREVPQEADSSERGVRHRLPGNPAVVGTVPLDR